MHMIGVDRSSGAGVYSDHNGLKGTYWNIICYNLVYINSIYVVYNLIYIIYEMINGNKDA